MADTFLAFSSKLHPPRDGRTTERQLDAGVHYDIADEIDKRNNWLDPGELDGEVAHAMVEIAARGLSELFLFCFNGQVMDKKGKGMRTAFRRFVSVAWMIKSAEIKGPDGRPLSLEKLSKLPQVRCTRCTLSLLAQEFGRRWGFRVRVQKKETTKPNYAHAAKGGWKKRRDREKKEANISGQ